MKFEDFSEIPTRNFYGAKRYKHLQSALEEVASSSTSNEVDIVIIPPDIDSQTDEEYFDENDLQMPSDVAGEIELWQVSNSDDEDSDDEFSLPLSVVQQNILRSTGNPPPSKKQKLPEPKWTKTFVDTSMSSTAGCADRLEILKNELENLTPVQIFEKIFDDDIYNHIVSQTNLYSSQKNRHDFFVSKADIKLFVGILLLTGYNKLPSERNYWSLDEDLGVPVVSNAMSRNRFQDIKRNIHLANNDNLNQIDKMAKLRPLISLLNQKFQQWGVFHEHLSIDEAMVKFFGRHSSKQYIKGKPVRFGYKNWMLCSSTGYCYAFDTYCGAKNNTNGVADLPLGSRVVLDLLECVAVPSDHIIFFDNYFSSHGLLKSLKERGQRATGTVRENRTRKCPLTSVKMFKKKVEAILSMSMIVIRLFFLSDGKIIIQSRW